jgi:hypothetical protein
MASKADWQAVITDASGNPYYASTSDIPQFNFSKSITDVFGNGTFYLVDADGGLASNFAIGKDFKFYYGLDSMPYTYGGFISDVHRDKKFIRFTVPSYMNLLKRETAQNETYTNLTGSEIAARLTASNGLVYKYYENNAAVQTPIYSSTYVRAAAGQDTFSTTFDNKTIFECLQEIASKSRVTGNSIPFDFWVDYDPTTTNIELWFNEKNASSSGITLNENVDFSYDFDVQQGSVEDVKNWIKVFGSKITYVPTNQDFWTEQVSAADYLKFWSVSSSCTLVRSTSPVKTGSSCVEFTTSASGATKIMSLFMTDADAYSASYTPDTGFFVSGSGIKLSSTLDTYLHFWTQMNWTQDPTGNYIKLELRGNNLGDSSEEDYIVAKDLKLNQGFYSGDGHAYDNIVPNYWYEFDIKVNDIIPKDKWPYCGSIHFTDDACANTNKFYVDNLFFYTKSPTDQEVIYSNPDAGTPHAKDATSIAAYGRRVMNYYDRALITQPQVDNMADSLLAQYKDPPYKYSIPLQFARSDITLGQTFVLNSPFHGISAQTCRCVEMQYNQEGQSLIAEKYDVYNSSLKSASVREQQFSTKIARETQRR